MSKRRIRACWIEPDGSVTSVDVTEYKVYVWERGKAPEFYGVYRVDERGLEQWESDHSTLGVARIKAEARDRKDRK